MGAGKAWVGDEEGGGRRGATVERGEEDEGDGSASPAEGGEGRVVANVAGGGGGTPGMRTVEGGGTGALSPVEGSGVGADGGGKKGVGEGGRGVGGVEAAGRGREI